MPDESELTLLERQGLRINRDKDIRENLADELAGDLTEDEAAHLRSGIMPLSVGCMIALLRRSRPRK